VGPQYFPVFVLKKSPLTPAEVQGVHLNMHEYEYSTRSSFIPFIEQERHIMPMGEGIYHEHEMLNQALYLMAQGKVSPEELIKSATFEARAVTDDDPFFYKVELGIPSIVILLLALSLIAIALGWLIMPGFMVVEIPLIQKFILFLGQPVYSMAVLLFSLLIGAGIGSWVGGAFWRGRILYKLRLASMVVGVLVGMYIFFLPHVFTLFMGSPFYSRILISLCIVAPLGFFMGGSVCTTDVGHKWDWFSVWIGSGHRFSHQSRFFICA
jgi:hypothetical protein